MKNRIYALCLILAMLAPLICTNVFAEPIWDPFGDDTDVNVVYLGGSITTARGWRTSVGEWLEKTYKDRVPGRTVTNYDAGIGGTGSDYGLLRLERDVLSKNPDLVFVEFAVNDANTAQNDALANMEGIVRTLQSAENLPMIVFVYTTGTNFKTAWETHHRVAEYYSIPELDFRGYMISEGYEGVTGVTYENLPTRLKSLWSDLTHPNADGHKLWSDYAISEFEKSPKKYFRHAELKKNKLSGRDFPSMEYISANDAYSSGVLKLTGGADSFKIGKNGLDMTSGAKAEFTFDAESINVYGKTSVSGGSLRISCDGKSKTADTGSQWDGVQTSLYSDSTLKDGTHTLVLESIDEKNAHTDGFFIGKSELSYPDKYPEGAHINKGEDADEKPRDNEHLSQKYKSEIKLATDLGIFGDEIAEKIDQNITRKEFARLISSIVRPNYDENQEWYKNVFSQDKNFIVVEKDAGEESFFEDVEVNNEYLNDINTVYGLSLMIGKSKERFAPDDTVTVSETVKVFMNMLGYSRLCELNGGYPTGYMSMATDLGLLRGLKNSSAKHELTFSEIARVLYNLYDQKMFGIDKVNADSVVYDTTDDTFLTKYLHIDWIKGRVKKTKMSTLDSGAINGDIIVGDFRFVSEDKDSYINDYIGRNVKVYYNEDKNEDMHIVSAYLLDNDDVISISAHEFKSYSAYRFTYLADDKDREKSVSISKSADVLYNGRIISVFNEDTFKFDKGNITLISTKKDGNYDIVTVNDFADWYVIANDTANMKLYRMAPNGSREADNYIDYSESGSIMAVDSDGENIDIQSIGEGDKLSVAKNGTAVRIIKNTTAISDFTAAKIDEDDFGHDTVSDGENEYSIVSDYIGVRNFVMPTSGNTYSLYLDSFGYVMWVDMATIAKKNEGYLIRAEEGTSDMGDETVFIKIVGFDSVVSKYETAEKVKIIDESGKSNSCKSAYEASELLAKYSGYVSFKTDEDGKLKEIELARSVPDKSGSGTVMYDLAKTEGMKSETFQAKSYINMFSSATDRVYTNRNSTVFLYCPSDIDENRYRASKTMSDLFVTDNKYTIHAYGRKLYTNTADFVVCYETSPENTKFYMRDNVYVVNRVTEEYFDDDTVDKIYATKLNTNGTATAVEMYSTKNDTQNKNGESCSFIEACPDLAGTEQRYRIEVGDIIAAEVDKFRDGVISRVFMIYKASAYPENAPEGIKPGWIVGAGYGYDTANKNLFGNPYAVYNSALANASSYSVYGTRVLKGYVLSNADNVLRFTTQDLSSGAAYDPTDGRFITNVDNSLKRYTVNYEGKKVKVSGTFANDIKTYENYGKNASAVLMVSYGTEGVIIIINR